MGRESEVSLSEDHRLRTESAESALAAAIASVFGTANRVVFVGADSALSKALCERSDLFTPIQSLADTVDAGTEVLAVSVSTDVLDEAMQIARSIAQPVIHVLARRDDTGGASREALRDAGLVLADATRVAWATSPNGRASGVSRAERIDGETRATILRCIRRDDSHALELLEGALLDARRQLDVYAEMAVEHAATREVERLRAERLEKLEGLVGTNAYELSAEVQRLQAELGALQSTRVWRTGQAWWRFRDRISGRSR